MTDLISVWVMSHHPVCHGGGGLWIGALASLMEETLSGFGEAVQQIEIDIYFGTKLGPLKSFEQHWPNYHQRLETLPKGRFLRKKRSFKLEIHARFAPAEEALEPEGPSRKIPQALIGQPGALRKTGVELRQEFLEPLTSLVSSGLSILAKKLKKADGFDSAGFLAAAERLADTLPTDREEATQLVDRRRERQAAKQAADPWAAVDVDWDDFHPTAKEILDDPWYWSSGHDWAPHGNDAGADVLHAMTKQPQSAWTFVKESMDTLTRNGTDWMATESALALGIANADEQMYMICEQTLLAVAFAEIKLSGNCSDHFLQMALNALQRLGGSEMMQWWSGHLSPELQTEWKRRHGQMYEKLKELASQQGLTN